MMHYQFDLEITQMGLMNTKEVLALLKISKVTLNNLIESGSFPTPIILGKRKRHWREADVHAWVAAQ